MYIVNQKKIFSVQIIVLCQNKLDITKQCLESIYKNSKTEFGIFILDNSSVDNTRKFLSEKYSNKDNATIYFSDKNLGCGGGRNKAWDLLGEIRKDIEYIIFLDNDQLVEKNWLSHHLSVLNEGYDIVAPEAWQVGNSFLPTKHNTKLNEPFHYLGCGGMMIKKKVIDNIGLFDNRFSPSYFEDPDFSFRASDALYKLGWNFNAKIVHLGTTNIANDKDKRGRFFSSLQKFREKWKGYRPKLHYQTNLKEFEK